LPLRLVSNSSKVATTSAEIGGRRSISSCRSEISPSRQAASSCSAAITLSLLRGAGTSTAPPSEMGIHTDHSPPARLQRTRSSRRAFWLGCGSCTTRLSSAVVDTSGTDQCSSCSSICHSSPCDTPEAFTTRSSPLILQRQRTS